MATSNTNDPKPTDKETFQHNLAPESKGNAPKDEGKIRTPGSAEESKREARDEAKPEGKKEPFGGKGDHDNSGKVGGAKKADPKEDKSNAEESPAIQRQKYQEKLEQEFQDQIKESRKGTPVDALGLPEGEGDEVWANAVEIAPRDSETDEEGKSIKETDKAYDKRVSEGEASLVKGAIEFLSPLFGSLRPLGYNLTKTDTHIRLAIVDTKANPDPAKIGGKPNELGRY